MKSTDTSELLNSVRRDISDVMVNVDKFISKTEKQIKERESEIDGQIKEHSTLKIREKKLKRAKKLFAEEKNAVEVQKEANRNKKIVLDKQERKINEKLETVKNILS